jgi:hypothetical protein
MLDELRVEVLIRTQIHFDRDRCQLHSFAKSTFNIEASEFFHQHLIDIIDRNYTMTLIKTRSIVTLPFLTSES